MSGGGLIKIDLEEGNLVVEESGQTTRHDLGSPEAFGIISKAWLRSGWDNKYVYGFSWLGRPIIQLPEDLLRIQEVLYRLQPDLIIETGIAHGGSLMFYASLCKLMGKGRVVGVDIDIRPHNKAAIKNHALSSLITLIEGDSIHANTIRQTKDLVAPGETVIVLLDSGHSKEHVLAELNGYSPLVSRNSYIVAMDGIMADVAGAPRTQPDWTWNNPKTAALEFVQTHPDFEIEEPIPPFNESNLKERVTYWPSAFIKRIK
jgi:cephalosporin hydroxylase